MNLPFWKTLSSVWSSLPLAARRKVLFATNAHFLVGVVGIIRNPAGEILLLEHRFRTPHRWGLPGGFIDHGESFTDALCRELSEEVGLGIEPEGVVDTEYSVDGRYLSVALTATTAKPADLRLDKNHEIMGGGFYPADAPPPGMYPHHAELLRRFAPRAATDLASD